MSRIRSVVGLLRRNPDFARLYTALLIAFAADWFATVALIDLVLEATDSAGAASIILVLQMAPFLLATPIAGVLADRFDRRRLLAGANFGRAMVSLGLLLAVSSDTVLIAFAVVALLAFGAAVFEPTVSASLPNLVDREDLPTANALIASAWGTMVAMGAAIGGLVTSAGGRELTFLVYPLLFVASGVLVWSVRRPLREAGADPVEAVPAGLAGLRSTFTETYQLARRDRSVASLLLTKPTFGVATGIVSMLAITSDEIWGSGAAGAGILFAARGLGALVGPFAARGYATDDRRRLLTGIGISFVVYLVGYALIPVAPVIWIAAVFVFIGHLGGGAQWVLSSFGLQRAAPDRIRGRVFSVDFGLALAVSSISTLVAGYLAGVIGSLATLYVMLGAMAVTVAVWFWWTRPIRRDPSQPAVVVDEPPPHATPEPPM
jgi:MFS family permease